MIQRFKNSWALMNNSVDVLSRNLKLLIFPFVTFCATIVIFLFFFGTFMLQPTGHGYTEKEHWKAVASTIFTQESMDRAAQTRQPGEAEPPMELNRNGALLAAALYFFAMFLATFFNVAFYHEILEALNGRPVGLLRGFTFALSKIVPIAMWSLLAGAVGYAIKQMERRVGFLGRLIVGMIGLAWSVASVFAIPVIICEAEVKNPFNVLKMSAASLKKTWGETLIGFLGLQLAAVLVIFLSAIPFGTAMFLAVTMNSGAVIAVAWLSWIIFIFAFSYFTSVASNVFHAALYVFASTGNIPTGFTREMMDAAWKHRPPTAN